MDFLFKGLLKTTNTKVNKDLGHRWPVDSPHKMFKVCNSYMFWRIHGDIENTVTEIAKTKLILPVWDILCLECITSYVQLNTFISRYRYSHFGDTLKCMFLDENAWLSIRHAALFLGVRLIISQYIYNILKPGVKSRVKMKLEQRRQAMLQLHLSDQQFYCLQRRVLY